MSQYGNETMCQFKKLPRRHGEHGAKSDKEHRYAINLEVFSVVLYGLCVSVVRLLLSKSTKGIVEIS